MKRLTSDDLAPYVEAGYSLIPLKRWDTIDARGRERGKSPRDPNWRSVPYELAAIYDWAENHAGNVGVRLRRDEVVIDYDPRNDPQGDSVRRLCERFGLNLAAWPHVRTGSGGDHWYGRLPEGVRVLNGLDEFPGVEFKSAGRQVVAAGSTHPNGNVYELDDFAPPFTAAPMISQDLLEAIRRPERATTATGEGAERIDQDHLERCLAQLDVGEYAHNHDAWFELMQAVHYASGGSPEGRAAFITWSTADPTYATDTEVIGDRWDSLNANAEGGITTRTLFKHVGDAGGNPHPDPASDFEALGPIAEDGEYVPRFKRMNGGLPARTVPNAVEAIRALGLDLKRDLFHHVDVVAGAGLARFRALFPGIGSEEMTDDACAAIADLAFRRWRLDVSVDQVMAACQRLALRAGFNPLTEWLDSLEWDGTERIGSWLIDYAGAEANDYSRAVGRITLMGAVARGYAPGTPFQTMTVLEGPQGSFKSTLVMILGGPRWTLPGIPHLRNAGDKDVVAAMTGKWIVEFDELENLRKADITTMKAFLSRHEDRVRLPYARKAQTFPRQCVFIGTTNETEYLRDTTGNRRFYPVRTGRIDTEALIEDRDQLWAECAHIWRHDPSPRHLTLDGSLWADAAVEQEQRRIVDSAEGVVEEFLGKLGANWVSTRTILADCFNELNPASDNAKRITTQRLPALMQHAGWRKSTRRFNGARGYERINPDPHLAEFNHELDMSALDPDPDPLA